jgi:hypothetical protein
VRGHSDADGEEAAAHVGISPAAIAVRLWAPFSAARMPPDSRGSAIWNHLLRLLSNRSDVKCKLLRARVGRFADLALLGRGSSALLNPEIRLDLFWPSACPVVSRISLSKTFIIATNDLDRKIAYRAGALRAVIAGPMAIPGLVWSSLISDRLLIDGGL